MTKKHPAATPTTLRVQAAIRQAEQTAIWLLTEPSGARMLVHGLIPRYLKKQAREALAKCDK